MNSVIPANAVAVLVSVLFAAEAYALTPREIAAKALPSVVVVSAIDETGKVIASGSGFFVADEIIASNLHVVEGASRGMGASPHRLDRFSARISE